MPEKPRNDHHPGAAAQVIFCGRFAALRWTPPWHRQCPASTAMWVCKPLRKRHPRAHVIATCLCGRRVNGSASEVRSSWRTSRTSSAFAAATRPVAPAPRRCGIPRLAQVAAELQHRIGHQQVHRQLRLRGGARQLDGAVATASNAAKRSVRISSIRAGEGLGWESLETT